jgi:hypothetical protein
MSSAGTCMPLGRRLGQVLWRSLLMNESILSKGFGRTGSQGWKPRCQFKRDRPGFQVRVYGARGPVKGASEWRDVSGLVGSASHTDIER